MFDLEKEIKENKAYFDGDEPDEGHRMRFANKLGKEMHSSSRRKYILWWKYAAAMVIVAATSYTIINNVNFNSDHSAKQIVFSEELQEVQDYYDVNVDNKLEEIDEIAVDEKQAKLLKAKAVKEMEKIDADLAMIEKEYVKNPQCDKLKAAIITSKQKKVEVVENIVKQAGNTPVSFRAGGVYTGI